MFHSAPSSKDSRREPVPDLDAKPQRAHGRGRRASGRRRRVCRSGHGRVLGRAGRGKILLFGSQHAPASRASCDGTRDGSGSGAVAVPSRARRGIAVDQTGSRSRAMRSRRVSMPKTHPRTFCRPSGQSRNGSSRRGRASGSIPGCAGAMPFRLIMIRCSRNSSSAPKRAPKRSRA